MRHVPVKVSRKRFCPMCRDFRSNVRACLCGAVFCDVCSIEGLCLDCGINAYHSHFYASKVVSRV